MKKQRVIEIANQVIADLNIRRGSICYHLKSNGELTQEEEEEFKKILIKVFIDNINTFDPTVITNGILDLIKLEGISSISADIYIFVHGDKGVKERLKLLNLIIEKYGH